MKVRNIVFSGFAAAILMGTANAAVPFQIASKAYVDPAADGTVIRTTNTTGENLTALDGAIRDAAASADTIGDMDDLNDENTNFGENTDTVVEALNDLDSALNTKQNVSDSTATQGTHVNAGNGVGANLNSLDSALVAVETKVGETSVADQIDDKLGTDFTGDNPAYTDVTSALDGKVNVSDKATSIRTVAGGASDDKWATEKAVAEQIEGITGGAGTVDQQIADALGDDFTGDGAYADVTAALADKQDKADSNVTTAGTYIQTGTGVAANLGRLDTAAKAAKDAADAAQADADTLDAQINGDPEDPTNNGLAGDVADLQDALNDQTNGLTPRVAALEDKVGDGQLSQDFGNGVETLTDAVNNLMANKLNSPIPNTCSANSLHCVLHMDSTGALSWVDVTAPFEIGE